MAVLNLSNYKLNDSEITLLAKGLKFTTSQWIYNACSNVLHDIKIARNRDANTTFTKFGDIKMHSRIKVWFEPKSTGVAFESYIDKTKIELTSPYNQNDCQSISIKNWKL